MEEETKMLYKRGREGDRIERGKGEGHFGIHAC